MLGTLASAAKGVFQKMWQQAGGRIDRLSGSRTQSPKGILCSHLLDVVLERPDVLQPHPPHEVLNPSACLVGRYSGATPD